MIKWLIDSFRNMSNRQRKKQKIMMDINNDNSRNKIEMDEFEV